MLHKGQDTQEVPGFDVFLGGYKMICVVEAGIKGRGK